MSGTFLTAYPKITFAILARDHAYCLPEYLQCLDRLDYPKNLIALQVRTNDNKDTTREILEEWLSVVGSEYCKVTFDDSPIDSGAEAGHLWNERNLSRIAFVRQQSLDRFAADDDWSDFYFVCDVDNFLTNPQTLKELVRRREPIAAPLLENLPHGNHYANFFAACNEYGYYEDCPEYYAIRWRKVQGTIVVPVVHCTYLAERSVIVDKRVTYVDDTNHYDFVIFTRSARRSGVRQVLVNDSHFGYLLHGMVPSGASAEEPAAYERLCKPTILAAMREHVK